MMKENGRKWNNKGAAMMVAVVIIGILMVFIFSLLLVSYTLYASQNKKAAGRRNSEAANSLSQAMETELTRQDAPTDSALWKYLRLNVLQDSWPYYDPEKEGHGMDAAFRYFDLKYQRSDAYKDYFHTDHSDETGIGSLDGFPGNIEICMYYELPEGTAITGQTQNIANKSGTVLNMEITCETGNQTYVVTNRYVLTQTEGNSRAAATALESAQSNPEYYNPFGNTVDSDEKWVWELESRE